MSPADAVVAVAGESDYPGLHAALDVVAREKRFLAATAAPPYAQSVGFYRSLAAGGWPHLVARVGDEVVGWVDVAPTFGQSRAHIGLLGIALVPAARGQGLGARLLHGAIERSWARELTRIELTVRTDNGAARRLYERFGFEHEGVRRRGSLIDGQYHDLHAMALLR